MIWTRNEKGNLLTLTNQFWIDYKPKSWSVVAADINAREGESSKIVLACFDSEEAAIRQLDDIQEWMWGGVSGITDSGVINLNVYDLRERKVDKLPERRCASCEHAYEQGSTAERGCLVDYRTGVFTLMKNAGGDVSGLGLRMECPFWKGERE